MKLEVANCDLILYLKIKPNDHFPYFVLFSGILSCFPEYNPNMANTKQDAFEAGLKKLMVAARPEMIRRLQDVKKAVDTFTTGTFEEEARKQGHDQAHKLAGVLGTYGLTMGSRIAHELEVALELD